MKKKALRPLGCAVVIAALLFVQQSIRSQVSDPSTWGHFVGGTSNPLVIDTFRMQTFEGLATDNWKYSSKGGVSIVETSQTGITGRCGRQALKLPMDAEASFEHYPLETYQEIGINVHYGGKDREKGDNLMFRTYRPGSPELNTVVACKDKIETCSFDKPNKDNPLILEPRTTRVPNNPPGIDLVTSKPDIYSDYSCYCVDSVYAYGQIPAYSLFSGDGNWNDTLSWSHLPAARYRNALIQGEISVNSDVRCNDLALDNGYLQVLSAGHLAINNLTIHSNDNLSSPSSVLRSSGTIKTRGAITVQKTFIQKGKWFFISFPFDIYPSGIDPDFQLGDTQNNEDGNYFYLQTYNAEKRATQQSSSGNWETVSRNVLYSGKPLLQKGKGYLIALDAGADRLTLRFTSQPHILPTDFGRNGTSQISAAINGLSGNPDHNGWYLCGNPLPSELPLNQIEPNKSLDGFVYLYDGFTYKAYAIGSNYAIPPFSAFFVKATENTELSVRNISLSKSTSVISTKAPLSNSSTEPKNSSVSNIQVESLSFSWYVMGKILHLADIGSPGNLHILNFSGSPIYSCPISSGDSSIRLSLPQGIYVLVVQIGQIQSNHKFILT